MIFIRSHFDFAILLDHCTTITKAGDKTIAPAVKVAEIHVKKIRRL